MHWHTCSIACVGLFLSGCYLAHDPAAIGTPGEEPPITEPPITEPPITEPPITEPPPPSGPPVRPGPTCDAFQADLEVSVDTLPGSSRECGFGTDVPVSILSAFPEGEALIVTTSDCPFGADCDSESICQFRIQGTLVDRRLAEDTAEVLQFVGDFLLLQAGPDIFRLQLNDGCCRGSGCFCPSDILFLFRGNPASVRYDPYLSLGVGPVTCETEGCGTTNFDIRLETRDDLGGVIRAEDLPPGEYPIEGAGGFLGVTTLHIGSAVNNTCEDDFGPQATWALWVASPENGDG
ncbi:MAG: hypothetical protein AAGF12_30225 [Myxococcota bacterium]